MGWYSMFSLTISSRHRSNSVKQAQWTAPLTLDENCKHLFHEVDSTDHTLVKHRATVKIDEVLCCLDWIIRFNNCEVLRRYEKLQYIQSKFVYSTVLYPCRSKELHAVQRSRTRIHNIRVEHRGTKIKSQQMTRTPLYCGYELQAGKPPHVGSPNTPGQEKFKDGPHGRQAFS